MIYGRLDEARADYAAIVDSGNAADEAASLGERIGFVDQLIKTKQTGCVT